MIEKYAPNFKKYWWGHLLHVIQGIWVGIWLLQYPEAGIGLLAFLIAYQGLEYLEQRLRTGAGDTVTADIRLIGFGIHIGFFWYFIDTKVLGGGFWNLFGGFLGW